MSRLVSLLVLAAPLALSAEPPAARDIATTPPATTPAPAPKPQEALSPVDLARSAELKELTEAGRALFEEFEKADASPATALPQGEKERRVKRLVARYEALLKEAPDHLETLLLYAKFLRQIGERDEAFTLFLRVDKLDPNLATVKHQLGAHLAEDGSPADALPLLRRAIELAPAEPRYHHDFAEFLVACGSALVLDSKLTREECDRLILRHFDEAARLKPAEAGYRWRAAEARHDIRNPDAADALAKWDALDRDAKSAAEKETIGLHRAYWLIRLNRTVEARRLIDASKTPALAATRARLSDELLRRDPALKTPFSGDKKP